MKSAIEHILNSTSEIFEAAWQKEAERIQNILTKFDSFEVTPEMISAVGTRISRFSNFPYGKSDEEVLTWKKSHLKVEMFILTSMLGWSLDKLSAAQRRGIYNTLDSREYNQYQDWSLILSKYQNDMTKFELWFQKYKEDYYADLVAKLRQAINRYLQGYEVKPYTRVQTSLGPRGYEISCDVISPDGSPKTFYTQAHGAGGWNIQKYHYRYRSNLR